MSSSSQAVAGAMNVHFTMQEMYAQNIANIETPGFKRVLARIGSETSDGADGATTTPGIEGIKLDMSQGALQPTSNPLDMAIKGDGFFTIQSENGTRYTRNGHFRMDANRILVNERGDKVTGQSGEIQIPQGAKKISIDRSGNVLADGESLDILKIVRFEKPEQIRQLGHCEYDGTNAGELDAFLPDKDGKTAKVIQGSLERSNVSPIGELVSMLASYREYEACARSIKSLEQTATNLYRWARG
jgi:flagellar basal-body rod protein FlgF